MGKAQRLIEDVDGVMVPAETRTVRARDRCVVDSEPLAQALAGFVDSWNRRHVPNRRRRTADTEPGAVSWLAQKTGIPEKTIQNITRRDPETGVPAPRGPFTDLRIADALVTAIGQPHLLSSENSPLVVKARPRSSAATRAACCGGSLTGSTC